MVDEKVLGTDVADAARFAEQARNERNEEEETNRTAELRTSQKSAGKVSDDTQKTFLELEDAIAALRADTSIRRKKETGLRKTVRRVLSRTRKEVTA